MPVVDMSRMSRTAADSAVSDPTMDLRSLVDSYLDACKV